MRFSGLNERIVKRIALSLLIIHPRNVLRNLTFNCVKSAFCLFDSLGIVHVTALSPILVHRSVGGA